MNGLCLTSSMYITTVIGNVYTNVYKPLNIYSGELVHVCICESEAQVPNYYMFEITL